MLRWCNRFLRWICRRSKWRWAWRACRQTRDNEGTYCTHDLRRVFRVRELPVYFREASLSRMNPSLWHIPLPLLFKLKKAKAAFFSITDVWMMPAASTMKLEEKRGSWWTLEPACIWSTRKTLTLLNGKPQVSDKQTMVMTANGEVLS